MLEKSKSNQAKPIIILLNLFLGFYSTVKYNKIYIISFLIF